MIMPISAYVPGKIILAGEHAVAHGVPAIAMAVNTGIQVTLTPLEDTAEKIGFSFDNTPLIPIDVLAEIHADLQQRYALFKKQQYPVENIIQNSQEFVIFAVMQTLKNLNFTPPSAAHFSFNSNIPIGSGMGSSAAVTIGIIRVLLRWAGCTWSVSEQLKLGKSIENLQHGTSSGLDLQTVLQDGCLHWQQGVVNPRPLPNWPLKFVQTGKPATTTGQCVEHTHSYFKQPELLQNFRAVVDQFDQALCFGDQITAQYALREHHRLLCQIGVVPARVQQFIQDVEALGGAAKTCGAGSIAGDQAGIVCVFINQDITPLCHDYGYQCLSFGSDVNGLRY